MSTPDWFSAALEEAPERTTVDVEGAGIETLAWGERGKPGLLLVHGAGAHADWWSFIAPLLARDYRVAAFSLSGMGRSSQRERYSIPLYAREAFAAAEAAGLFEAGPPIFVGHSFGGRATLQCAAGPRAQELKAALALDTLIRPPELQVGGRPFGDKPRFYDSLEAGVARFRLVPPQPCDNPFILDYIAPRSLKQTAAGWTWCFDPLLWGKLEEHSTVEDLRGAKIPVGMVWGQHSRLMVPAVTDYVRANAPQGMPIVVVPEAHHHLMLDQPLALIAALRGLFAGWPR